MKSKFFSGLFTQRNAARTDHAVAVFDRIRRSEQLDADVPPMAIWASDVLREHLEYGPDVNAVQLFLDDENASALSLFPHEIRYGERILGSAIALEDTIHRYLTENPDPANPYVEPLKRLQHVLQKIVAFSTEIRPDRIRKLIEAIDGLIAAEMPDDPTHDKGIRDIYGALYFTLALSDAILTEAANDRLMNMTIAAMLCKPPQEICTRISGEQGVLKEIVLKDEMLVERSSTPGAASEEEMSGPS